MCAFFPFHLALKAEPIQLCALCVCVYVCACTEARLCTVLVKRERERGDAGASRIPAGAGGCRPGCVNGARWVSGSHVCRLFDPLSGRAVTTGWPRCMGLGLLTHTPTGFDTHTHTHYIPRNGHRTYSFCVCNVFRTHTQRSMRSGRAHV